ncbi:MAG: hypothetical protein MJE68_19185 [Proteobacteria bacterium]|nr:hypothetical protein [Pseudomonadota bacterium]
MQACVVSLMYRGESGVNRWEMGKAWVGRLHEANDPPMPARYDERTGLAHHL